MKPSLDDFFEIFKDQKYQFHTYLGNSAFDKFDNYPMLINDYSFTRALIPTNPRNSDKNTNSDNITINKYGIPVCSKYNLPFLNGGICKSKNRSTRIKFHCPKTKVIQKKRTCFCETPCSDSSYGKTTYTYFDQNLRFNPGISRATNHFKKVYKIRVIVERTIDSFKSNMAMGNTHQRKSNTIKSDLLVSGITQLITILLADKLSDLKNFKSIRNLLKAS